jgi:hypothetical protein
VAVAPKRINIKENPRIKNKELIMMVFLFCFSPFFISSKDIPEMKEIYPGTKGKTQGEINEKSPATKAAIKDTSLTLNVVIIRLPLKLV